MATVNVPHANDVVSRRVLLVSGGLLLALALSIGAFFALRGRLTPLWLERHGTPRSATP